MADESVQVEAARIPDRDRLLHELRDAGLDAVYMKGGHSAWKAIGGPLKLYT